jgi:hypothetical protein
MLPSTATLLLSLPRHSSPSCLMMTRRSFAGRARQMEPTGYLRKAKNLVVAKQEFVGIHYLLVFFSFSELFYSFGMTS